MRKILGLTITDNYQIIGIRGGIIKGTKDPKGYIIIKIKNKGVRRSHIIAQAFPEICGEWFEGAEVHHKDHNKTNDVPENLKVVSHSEHVLIHMDDHPGHEAWNKGKAWSVDTKKKMSKSALKRGRTHSKPVRVIINDVVTIYDAASDASKATGVDYRMISAYCTGRRRQPKGYIFEFV